MADADIKIISRPKEAPPGEIKIISRPTPAEPDVAADEAPPKDEGYTGNVVPLRRDAQGLHPAWPRVLQEMYHTAIQGGEAARSGDIGQMERVAPGAAALAAGGSAVPGAVSAAKGMSGPGIAGAVDAVVNAIKTKAPELVKEAGPAVDKAATAVGGVAHSTVDAVEDLVKTRMANRTRSVAEKAANAAPTKDSLYGDAGKAFEQAKAVGGDVDPQAFRDSVSGLKDALKASDVDLVNHPDNYDQTGKMLKAIERVAGSAEEGEGSAASDGITSFNDLIKLQRSLRPYIRKAKAAGAREGDDTDFRAAMILKKQVDNFMAGQGDEANAALTQGKDLYKRASKVDDVDEILSQAKRLNNPDIIRDEFTKIAKDPYTYNNYTPAEQALIDKIARNSTLDNMNTGMIGGKFSKGAKVAALLDNRAKLAEQLKDMIARGGEAQKTAAAEKAAKPSAFQSLMGTLRPDGAAPVNRRGFPYADTSGPQRPVEIIDVPGLRKP